MVNCANTFVHWRWCQISTTLGIKSCRQYMYVYIYNNLYIYISRDGYTSRKQLGDCSSLQRKWSCYKYIGSGLPPIHHHWWSLVVLMGVGQCVPRKHIGSCVFIMYSPQYTSTGNTSVKTITGFLQFCGKNTQNNAFPGVSLQLWGLDGTVYSLSPNPGTGKQGFKKNEDINI